MRAVRIRHKMCSVRETWGAGLGLLAASNIFASRSRGNSRTCRWWSACRLAVGLAVGMNREGPGWLPFCASRLAAKSENRCACALDIISHA